MVVAGVMMAREQKRKKWWNQEQDAKEARERSWWRHKKVVTFKGEEKKNTERLLQKKSEITKGKHPQRR
jgi:hypothetical protein